MVGHLSYGAPDPNPAGALPVDRGPVTHSTGASGGSWCGNDDVADDPAASVAPSLYFDPPPPTFGGLLGPETFGCLVCAIAAEEIANAHDSAAGSAIKHRRIRWRRRPVR